MEKFSFLAVLLLFNFCTCALTQEVNVFPYDSYAPKSVGEDNSLYEAGTNPYATVDVDDNLEGGENPELRGYQPVDALDKGKPESKEYDDDDSEDPTDVEDGKYPETAEYPEDSVGVEGDENRNLGSYESVDDVDSGELLPSESKDYSEVSNDVEGDKYSEIADNPEGSIGAEGDENPDLGGYVPVNDVDSGELSPPESKDYSEVSAVVEGDKYPETADHPEVGAGSDENPDLVGYQPVDDVDRGELDPSESKDYAEILADVDVSKYPGTESYASVNVASEEGNEPSLTNVYPEETVDLADNSVETNVSPGPVNEGDNYPESDLQPENTEDTVKYETSDNYNNPSVPGDTEPYVTSSYPEVIGDVGANEPFEPTSYPDVTSVVDEEEPYVTTVSYPEGVGDVDKNEPNEPNGMAGSTDSSEGGMEIIPSEGDLPQEIPPKKGLCDYDDLKGLADRLIGDVRPMIPDIVNLPGITFGPFHIRSFFARRVSRFARSGQPVFACSDTSVTLNIPLYWEEPLIGYFELNVARLTTDVQVILPELEAEAIIDVRYTSSSTYVVHVRDVRFTRSSPPIVVTPSRGYFQSITNKLSSGLARIFQARIRQFLSFQFQQILQEQIVKFEVGFNYRRHYRVYY